MTILTDQYIAEYTGDGVTRTFSWNFLILEEEHLVVAVDSNIISAAEYVVSGIGVISGGSVTFNVAPADESLVQLLRRVPLTQELDLKPYDPFDADSLEAALDLIVMQIQQVSIGSGVFAPLVHRHDADEIDYDDSANGSGLETVQEAIDLLYSLQTIEQSVTLIITDDAGDGTPHGDLNNTDFTDQEGTTFATLEFGTGYTFFHKGNAYYWNGPRDTVGVGGNYDAIDINLIALATTTAASTSFDDTNTVYAKGANVQLAIETLDTEVATGRQPLGKVVDIIEFDPSRVVQGSDRGKILKSAEAAVAPGLLLNQGVFNPGDVFHVLQGGLEAITISGDMTIVSNGITPVTAGQWALITVTILDATNAHIMGEGVI